VCWRVRSNTVGFSARPLGRQDSGHFPAFWLAGVGQPRRLFLELDDHGRSRDQEPYRTQSGLIVKNQWTNCARRRSACGNRNPVLLLLSLFEADFDGLKVGFMTRMATMSMCWRARWMPAAQRQPHDFHFHPLSGQSSQRQRRWPHRLRRARRLQPSGPGLDFVAPSSGGWNDIISTDMTSTNGYTAGDYVLDCCSGTSAACPWRPASPRWCSPRSHIERVRSSNAPAAVLRQNWRADLRRQRAEQFLRLRPPECAAGCRCCKGGDEPSSDNLRHRLCPHELSRNESFRTARRGGDRKPDR